VVIQRINYVCFKGSFIAPPDVDEWIFQSQVFTPAFITPQERSNGENKNNIFHDTKSKRP